VETLEVNSISVVRVETARPLVFDPYLANRVTGSFILIDPATNATVAAGMIDRAVASTHRVSDLPAQFSWQIKDRALVLNVEDSPLLAESGTHIVSDPEAAELLQRLLDRLQSISKKDQQ
jgi:sulfate adenylyltransferase subunit 1 (EFTu-like GTPase family)